jgi:hypothetical protein
MQADQGRRERRVLRTQATEDAEMRRTTRVIRFGSSASPIA